jgi:hypothetical protein
MGEFSFFFWLVILAGALARCGFSVRCQRPETDGMPNCALHKPNA